ncbi:hypothetical protein P692DRAFT_201197796 [Suillus brevipes Sb2]|nr:hypothetical protein P692DRAFT_201197796 [Suillus brevipes Sb2]
MNESINHLVRAVNAFLGALMDFLAMALNFLQYLCQLTHSLQTRSRFQAKSRKFDEDISFLQRPVCCDQYIFPTTAEPMSKSFTIMFMVACPLTVSIVGGVSLSNRPFNFRAYARRHLCVHQPRRDEIPSYLDEQWVAREVMRPRA